MAVIAWRLPDDHHGAHRARDAADDAGRRAARAASIEWRVLLLSVALALISFGYGGLTSFSALFADELQRHAAQPVSDGDGGVDSARPPHDRAIARSHRPPARAAAVPDRAAARAGCCSRWRRARARFCVAALVFGAGFGLMYPAYTAYVMAHVPSTRRGAAFGAMLAAFDTGIGTGSSMMGWLIHQFGYRLAFGAAAALAALCRCFVHCGCCRLENKEAGASQ